MQIKQLIHDDDAVSPVIGVILMVAITVILAAVIATFVLGLGDQVSSTAPQASFSFDWNGGSGGADTLNITHDGGDSIEADNLYARGQYGSNSPSGPGSVSEAFVDLSGVSGGDTVSAGITVKLPDIGSDGNVRVIWEDASAENSATLSDWEGPEA
jgi:flagellin-like protein